jgi:hypothetical protein
VYPKKKELPTSKQTKINEAPTNYQKSKSLAQHPEAQAKKRQ